MSYLQDLAGRQILQQFPLFLLRKISGKHRPDSLPFPEKYQRTRIGFCNLFLFFRVKNHGFRLSDCQPVSCPDLSTGGSRFFCQLFQLFSLFCPFHPVWIHKIFYCQPAFFSFLQYFCYAIDMILICMSENYCFQTGYSLLLNVWKNHISSHIFLTGTSPVKQKCLSAAL